MRNIGASLDGIAPLFQYGEKRLQGKGVRDGGFYVLADQTAHGGFAVVFCVPLGVVLAFSVRLDYGQAVLPADLIRYSPDVSKVRLEVVAVVFAVHKGHGVEHDMTMQMVMIRMGGNDSLEAIPEEPGGKLNAQRLRLFRRDLAGLIGMDDVIAEDAGGFIPPALCGFHVGVGRFKLAVDGGLQHSAGL